MAPAGNRAKGPFVGTAAVNRVPGGDGRMSFSRRPELAEVIVAVLTHEPVDDDEWEAGWRARRRSEWQIASERFPVPEPGGRRRIRRPGSQVPGTSGRWCS